MDPAACSFTDILSPTTLMGSTLQSASGGPIPRLLARKTSPVARRLVTGIPAESCSLVITVCLFVPAASHPASRRRSCFNFSPAHGSRRTGSSTRQDHAALRRMSGSFRGAISRNWRHHASINGHSSAEDHYAIFPNRLAMTMLPTTKSAPTINPHPGNPDLSKINASMTPQSGIRNR